MIIKSFEIDKINIKSNNFYLFYGENEGSKNEAIEKIKKDQKIKKFLDGNNIIRSIFVKNKLINLIIK